MLKPDAEQIKQFLINLGKQNWVNRTERNWWPQFIFHYTDIQNAIKILQSACLYSREHLEKEGSAFVSNGSPTILAQTNIDIKNCVRLYFRPKTPTQYYAEGIHSQTSLSQSRFSNAHCPVPIFFLFKASKVLSDTPCRFSDGNLVSNRAHIFSTAVDLARLPWKQIYHNGWIDFSLSESRNIIFHRHAEVIVPQKLDLEALRYIYCRSEAEREMLLHSLPPHLTKLYQSKIIATTRSTLFYRQRTFIEKVQLSSERIVFHFSPDTKSPGPFLLRVDIETPSSYSWRYEEKNFTVEKPLPLKLPHLSTYTVRLLLDTHLAYANSYEEMALPF